MAYVTLKTGKIIKGDNDSHNRVSVFVIFAVLNVLLGG